MIIYKITNKINSKIYIGQTSRPLEERWEEHCKNSSGCCFVRNAIQKYGKENFTIEIVAVCRNQAELDLSEKCHIAFNKSMAPNGYNLTSGGEHPQVTDEVRNKMSLSKLGKVSAFKGKKHSASSILKMSMSKIGKIVGPHSLETRMKMSVSATGKTIPEDIKAKISIANKGRKLSPEQIAKRTASQKGIKRSPETKAKISASLRKTRRSHAASQ